MTSVVNRNRVRIATRNNKKTNTKDYNYKKAKNNTYTEADHE